MTVRELMAELKKHDPASLVVLSKDAEGNGYSPLSNIDRAHYVAENTWSGELSDDPEQGVPAVCLWGVN